MDNQVFVPKDSPMKDFFIDVVKSYARYSGPNEIITFNPPETHGHEELHSQVNLINRDLGTVFKIKLEE